MFPDTEDTLTVPIAGQMTQALAQICQHREHAPDEAAEMWRRYQDARAAGVFAKLTEFIKLHGALEGERLRWLVNTDAGGVAYKLTLFLARDASLLVLRNDETVLDDTDGAHLVFEPGARGAWIALCFEEDARLRRQLEQRRELESRRAQAEREAKRNRFD